MKLKDSSLLHLSRRERQIMDIIYRRGRASAAEVKRELAAPPGYSTVRTLLTVLERRGHLRHETEGVRYIYYPTQERRRAGSQALRRVLRTFYGGSVEEAMAALLDASETPLTAGETRRLRRLITEARKAGR